MSLATVKKSGSARLDYIRHGWATGDYRTDLTHCPLISELQGAEWEKSMDAVYGDVPRRISCETAMMSLLVIPIDGRAIHLAEEAAQPVDDLLSVSATGIYFRYRHGGAFLLRAGFKWNTRSLMTSHVSLMVKYDLHQHSLEAGCS